MLSFRHRQILPLPSYVLLTLSSIFLYPYHCMLKFSGNRYFQVLDWHRNMGDYIHVDYLYLVSQILNSQHEIAAS